MDKTKIGWKNNVDKILFIIASLYLIFMGGLWLKNQQKATNTSQTSPVNENQQITETNVSPEINTNNSQNPDNNNNIEQNIATNKENIDSQLSPIANSSAIPSPPTPLDIPPLPENKTAVSNIPLPPPDLQPLPIPQPPQPTLNTSPTTPSQTKNTPATPSVPRVNKVPVINTLSTNPPSPTSTPVAINSTNSINGNSANIVEATEKNYTLVGLLQLPDSKSVALFKVNNLTERVGVGSEIGTTGWVLMAINDKQAVVSKQNQSVYLRVGETF